MVTRTVGIAHLSLSLEFLDRDSWMMFSLGVDFHPFIPAWEWVVIHRIVVVPARRDVGNRGIHQGFIAIDADGTQQHILLLVSLGNEKNMKNCILFYEYLLLEFL